VRRGADAVRYGLQGLIIIIIIIIIITASEQQLIMALAATTQDPHSVRGQEG
jgi:hypothetical protein